MQFSSLGGLGTSLTPNPPVCYLHLRGQLGMSGFPTTPPKPLLTFRNSFQALTTSTFPKFPCSITSTTGPVSQAPPNFRTQVRVESQSDSVVCISGSAKFPSSHSHSYKPNAQNSEHPTQVAHREEISACSFRGPQTANGLFKKY